MDNRAVVAGLEVQRQGPAARFAESFSHMKNRTLFTRRQFIKQTLAATATLGLVGCRHVRVTKQAGMDADVLERFGASLRGRIILPTDAAYENARRVFFWNPRTERQPAVIARCTHPDDVARSIEFAWHHQMEIAVRAGGHSHLGWGTSNGLVIDLSGMRQVTIDPAKCTARMDAGMLTGEVVRSAGIHGLAPVFGQCPGVGAAGIILGGGLGWLSGLYGAASDNMVSARMITAGGGMLSVDAESNPDLLWALRGGGGNFGVMTSFECRLHPVGLVTAGEIHYPVREARTVLRFFRDLMAEAPDSFQAALNLSPGDRGVFVHLCHAGEATESDRLLRSLRTAAKPSSETVNLQQFTEVAAKPGLANFRCVQALCLERLSDDVIDISVDRLAQAPAGSLIGIDHYMHGEVCRVTPDATAFSLRQPGTIQLRISLAWDDSAAGHRLLAWAAESWRLLRPASGERIYANYQTYEGKGSARAVYAGNHARLIAIKDKYDPTNFFRRNSNIEPSTG